MPKFSKVHIGKTKIHVEIADNILRQMKGLSFRKGIADNTGMLFDFGRDTYPGMTMMSMFFPLDMIWIDSNSRVVHIKKNAKPYAFWKIHVPKERARFVLEVKEGFAERNGIKIGNKVKFYN